MSDDEKNINSLLVSIDNQKDTKAIWQLLHGDLLPTHPWVTPTHSINYITLITLQRKLRFKEISILTCFLLGNGIAPDIILSWYKARRLVIEVNDKKSVRFLFDQYRTGNPRYYYWDLYTSCWLKFDGTPRVVKSEERHVKPNM